MISITESVFNQYAAHPKVRLLVANYKAKIYKGTVDNMHEEAMKAVGVTISRTVWYNFWPRLKTIDDNSGGQPAAKDADDESQILGNFILT